MANKNGYFQLVEKDGKTFIRLFPQNDGGEPILINEVREYLAFNNYEVDPVELNKVISNLTATVDFLVANNVGFAVGEYFKLSITEDRMKAIARFYPASDRGQELKPAEIVNDLKHKGIKVGINESAVEAYCKNKQYCTDIVLAEGQPPVNGTDASIEYFFNTDPNAKPTLNPDGTVDFFNLNTICSCTSGMKLAKLTREVKGERGYSVIGEPISPRDVKVLRLKYGANISISDDETEIYSNVDGHVSLVDDKVFVSNVLEVVDVDTAIGNIDYAGDVLVTGNVKSGFCVEAEGNIEVRGVIEGALVKAGRDIVIARGVNGMNKGIIQAEGNVIAKFIENASVKAGGYVHSEAIIHSSVMANGDVEVTGKRGFIVGGSVKSLGNVSAKTIGSEMGGETEIEVGLDPKIKQRAVKLEEAIRLSKSNIQKIEPILTTFAAKIKQKAPLTAEQIKYFQQLSNQYKIEKENVKNFMDEYDEISEGLENVSSDSSVNVSGTIYPGTKLTISEISQVLTKPAQHSKFVRDGADIRIRALI